MKIILSRSNLIVWTVKFIIYSLKSIGLAPFSIRTNTSIKYFRNTYTWAVESSNIGLGYNILITIFLPTIAAYFSQDVLAMDYKNKSSITAAIDTAQITIGVSLSFVILISWTLNKKKAIDIINRLLDVHTRLSSTKIPPSFRRNLILSFAHMIINIIVWTCLLALTLFTPGRDLSWTVIFALLPSIIIYWYIIEYSMIIGLVTVQLESINKNLLHFKQIQSSFLIDFHLELPSSSICNQLAALHSLQSCRTVLFETSQHVSDFFSIPVLFCTAYSFSSLVCNVYYLIIPVVNPNGVFIFTECFSVVIWIIVIVYPITSLFISVTETVKEVKLTGRMVHKLMASSTNQQIIAKLQQFSLQLLHENVNYTACGFFTLDLTLLHAMLGSTATYLVILIQFQ